MAYTEVPFPLRYVRQQAKHVDLDYEFTTDDRLAYLTNARRHEGQIVYDIDEDKLYKLNKTRDAWDQIGGVANLNIEALYSRIVYTYEGSGLTDNKVMTIENYTEGATYVLYIEGNQQNEGGYDIVGNTITLKEMVYNDTILWLEKIRLVSVDSDTSSSFGAFPIVFND